MYKLEANIEALKERSGLRVYPSFTCTALSTIIHSEALFHIKANID